MPRRTVCNRPEPVYKPELEEIKEIVINEMENVVSLKVPLNVDYGVGNNWLEAH